MELEGNARSRLPAALKSGALTPFEHRIMRLLATGLTRAEVASTLRVSTESVSHSLTCAKEKVGARTPIEAVAVLVRGGSI